MTPLVLAGPGPSYVAWWLSGRALDLRFTGQVAVSISGWWLLRNIGQLSLVSLRGR